MIRVLQVFTIMNRGGAESMIMNYYRNIDRTKVQFDFLVHRHEEGAFEEEIRSLGGRIYRMDPINIFNPKNYYAQLRNFFRQNPEYKIIHSHLNTLSRFPLKIAKEFSIPTRIAHAHTAIERISLSDIISPKEGHKETLKKLAKLFLRKGIHKHLTHPMACGVKAGKWLYGEDTDFEILNNAIDIRAFSPNGTIRQAYRQKFNVEDKLVIGHVGSFNSMKNHSYLLKVFYKLKQMHSDVKLILIGDGPLRSSIEQEIDALDLKDQVELLGIRPDVPDLCQMLDFIVFPSIYEGTPLALVEAQAAGLQVLASDSVPPEINLTGDIEFISLSLPPKNWAERLLKTYRNDKPDNYEILAKHGFDVISNTRKLEQLYLSMNKTTNNDQH